MSDPFCDDLIALLPNLRRFALSLCRRGDLAEDLVQITAERALRARASHDPETRLAPWLFRILRNAWIDDARRSRTRGVEVDIVDAVDAPSVDGVRDIEARLMLRKTGAALNVLPEEQRELLILVCMEGLSYREAAETLDVPIGTVMSRLARGRAALAKKVGIK